MGKLVGYVKAKLVLEGTIITDIKKKEWEVGKLLGQGGFGAIYTGCELPGKTKDKVIKIEPQSNGPLYTEINFYKRVCEEKDIKSWINEKKLKFLGMPRYISSGLQPDSDNRFLIMDRYGDDLHKILMRTDLSPSCLLRITINILDVLEYIHSKEYSHADIKALNILQGYMSSKNVYLLDFGMVTKFSNNGKHHPEKPDPKLKHNGTLEFCPRDSHRGLVSCRRSDIESLMYNLVFWLSWDRNSPLLSNRVGFGKLPWIGLIKNLGDKPAPVALLKQVAESKEKYMADTNLFLEEVGLAQQPWSTEFALLLKKVATLQYSEQPDYDGFRARLAAIIDIVEPGSASGSRKSTVDEYRDISWHDSGAPIKQSRRSSTRNTAGTRKRPSTDNLQEDPAVDTKPTAKKKQKPETSTKKRLLKTNNSCVSDEEHEPIMDVQNKIPKAAWSSRNVARTPTEGDSKENFNTPTTKPRKKPAASKSKPVTRKQPAKSYIDSQLPDETPRIPDDIASGGPSDISCYKDIIPGRKALDRLKATAAAASTRSSPRLNSRKGGISTPVSLPTTVTQSVSCQTTPTLSTK